MRNVIYSGAYTRKEICLGTSHVNNEDAMRVDKSNRLFQVADGIGSHYESHETSRNAVKTIAKHFDINRPQTLHDALERADIEIKQKCKSDGNERGTTLTALHVGKRGIAYVAHSGDSRLYRFREGVLEQITRDHTWRESGGDILPQMLGDTLTQSLGYLTPDARPFRCTLDIRHKDVYLLCTDGIHKEVQDSKIEEILKRVVKNGLTPKKAAKKLVKLAEKPNCDDRTAVVLKILQKKEERKR